MNNREKMENREIAIITVLSKYIGKTYAVGNKQIDDDHLENLRLEMHIADYLIRDVIDTYLLNRNRVEYSISRSSEISKNFLENLIDEIKELMNNEN